MDQNSVDQTDPEFQYPELCGNLHMATKTNLSFLEFLFFSNDSQPCQKEGRVDQQSLPDWLSMVTILEFSFRCMF
jgi:hypothetical protein